MPYQCAYGCTHYNPNCDACDSATSSDNPFTKEIEDQLLLEAAVLGLSLDEYLDSQEYEKETVCKSLLMDKLHF